ncbi:histidine kinase [Ulvibacter sp. MAR_2010_11]|uniref:histidine kinase n=1 Tax=Ulvibacter sp. MAR_2010_11 TaxID=1250229 RepID=UPI000C2CDEFB|nr:histidine kinase [Ulvibacter sp. MAR_2010_11]
MSLQSNSEVSDELAHLKLKTLRSQMNPHFIFNALNAIQFFITSENKKSAVIYLSVFSKLIRHYLNNIENDTVHLTDEFAMLQEYLKLQKLRYSHQFEYHLEYEEDLKTIEAVIPSFILQSLFENIIEHAIYNQYQNYKVVTVFSKQREAVEVKIRFSYNCLPNSPRKYIPDYREQMVRWQDQIRLLNKLKSYKIKKKVTFSKSSAISGGTIVLILPNLS